MTQKDIVKFTESMYNLAAIYGKDINDNLIKLYFVALSRYDYTDVEKAFGESVAKNKFFPKPAELIEIIDGNEDEHIDLAYQDAKKIIYPGFYHTLVLNNPITMAVIEAMGGQQSFYNAIYVDKHDDTSAFFEFKRLYRMYRNHYKSTGELPAVKYLPGYRDTLPGAEPVSLESVTPKGLPLGKTDRKLLGGIQ